MKLGGSVRKVWNASFEEVGDRLDWIGMPIQFLIASTRVIVSLNGRSAGTYLKVQWYVTTGSIRPGGLTSRIVVFGFKRVQC